MERLFSYCLQVGINAEAATQPELQTKLSQFTDELQKVLSTTELRTNDVAQIYTYNAPKMVEGFACSKALEPFNLATQAYGIPYDDSLITSPHTLRLSRLQQVIDLVHSQLRVDWVGIYRRMNVSVWGDTMDSMVKEAYYGSASRAIFPLSEEFAAHSNNSTVGLRGTAVVINDVEAHPGPYYLCDGAVLSECCLPIFDPLSHTVIGIVDAEAHQKQFFTPERVLMLCALCSVLGQYNLGIAPQ